MDKNHTNLVINIVPGLSVAWDRRSSEPEVTAIAIVTASERPFTRMLAFTHSING